MECDEDASPDLEGPSTGSHVDRAVETLLLLSSAAAGIKLDDIENDLTEYESSLDTTETEDDEEESITEIFRNEAKTRKMLHCLQQKHHNSKADEIFKFCHSGSPSKDGHIHHTAQCKQMHIGNEKCIQENCCHHNLDRMATTEEGGQSPNLLMYMEHVSTPKK